MSSSEARLPAPSAPDFAARRPPRPSTARAAPPATPSAKSGMKSGLKEGIKSGVRDRARPAATKAKAALAQARVIATAAPLIPERSVTGSALLAIVAIMSFLAAVTLGAVSIARTTASEWQAQVAREVTIQVRPVEGRELEADVVRAARIARTIHGVAEVRPYTREESMALLEPWLGRGLSLQELPVPRLIVVTAAPGAAPDLAALGRRLAAEVPSAGLDDHRGFLDRMQGVTRMVILIGFAILVMMVAATVLLVAFATRGAMAANRSIIEVLHFVGAKNRYIAWQFQRHFLKVGCTGAAIGGGAAILLFLVLWLVQRRADALDPAAAALVGTLVLGPGGYAGILAVLALIATVTVVASQRTVHRTLNALE